MDKAELLAQARGETVEEVRRRFSAHQIERAPSFNKHLAALRQAELESTGTEGDLAWVRLKTGRVFYSPVSHFALRRQYEYIADTLPSVVTEETLLAAIDVVQRYLTDFTWPPQEILPPRGEATIIELGAYLGHKTIRFAEELAGARGKVLAVEMMPTNCEILRKNIAANGFEQVVDVLPVGVWKEAGRITGYSKGGSAIQSFR